MSSPFSSLIILWEDYFGAIANLNLNNLDAAEKSAREAVRLDSKANPRAA